MTEDTKLKIEASLEKLNKTVVKLQDQMRDFIESTQNIAKEEDLATFYFINIGCSQLVNDYTRFGACLKTFVEELANKLNSKKLENK